MPWPLFIFLDPCRWQLSRRMRTRYQPSLSTWITQHPNVAGAIQWQNQPAGNTNTYAPPTQSHNIVWANWTLAQQPDLINAYRARVFGLSAAHNKSPWLPTDSRTSR
jgi:hypothetical protein